MDNRPVKTSKFQQRRVQQQRFQQQRREREQRDGERKKADDRRQQGRRFDFRRDQRQQIQYAPSIDIRPEWAVKEQIPFASLSKLSCSVGEADDLGEFGAVDFYDKAYDKLTARSEKTLERTTVRTRARGRARGRGAGGPGRRAACLPAGTRARGARGCASPLHTRAPPAPPPRAARLPQRHRLGRPRAAPLRGRGRGPRVCVGRRAVGAHVRAQQRVLVGRGAQPRGRPAVHRQARRQRDRHAHRQRDGARAGARAWGRGGGGGVAGAPLFFFRQALPRCVLRARTQPTPPRAAPPPPPPQIPDDRDNMNGLQQLSLEATAVNQSLSQQLVTKDQPKHELGAANPFAEGSEDLAPAGYRYRKWALGPDVDIVVRCEVNAALTTPKGEVQLALIRVRRRRGVEGRGGGAGAATHGRWWPARRMPARSTVQAQRPHAPPPPAPPRPPPPPPGAERVEPEGDGLAQEAGPEPRVGVRPRLLRAAAQCCQAQQSTHVASPPPDALPPPCPPPRQMLLTEAKNNKNKMARWTVEATLAGAEAIKWGYVSRAGPRDTSNHVVLNVQARGRRGARAVFRLTRGRGRAAPPRLLTPPLPPPPRPPDVQAARLCGPDPAEHGQLLGHGARTRGHGARDARGQVPAAEGPQQGPAAPLRRARRRVRGALRGRVSGGGGRQRRRRGALSPPPRAPRPCGTPGVKRRGLGLGRVGLG